MINPVLLNSFIEVVHQQNMVSAAKHLKITPAAISKHILSLEKQLGIQLLIRSTRRIDLTHEGMIYFEHAKNILLAYQQADAAISNTKDEPSGILKVVAGPEIANLYLIPHLQKFLERYPKICLYLEVTQTVPDVEKEKVDVVVGLSNGIPAHWMQRSLTQAKWIFCASKEYLFKNGTPKKPSDLKAHRIITRTQRNPNNSIQFKNGESIFFEPYLFLNDTREIKKCALNGLGIVQLHDYIIAQELVEKKLVEILSKYVESKKTIPIPISYSCSSHLHIKIKCFVDFMIEMVKML